MNEKQPYEKHLAEKLESLQPPGDSGKNWPAMKAMLDQQMPKTGGGRGGPWWMYGIIIGIFVIGTWLITTRKGAETDALVNSSVSPSGEVAIPNSNELTGKDDLTSSRVEKTSDTDPGGEKQSHSTAKAELNSPINSENAGSSSKTSDQLNDNSSTLTNTVISSQTNSPAEKEAGTKIPLPKESNLSSGTDAKADLGSSTSENKKRIVEKKNIKSNKPDREPETLVGKENFKSKKSIDPKQQSLDAEPQETVVKTKRFSGKGNLLTNSRNTYQTRTAESINQAIEEEDNLKATMVSFDKEIDLLKERNILFFQRDSIAADYASLVKPTAIVAKSRFKESTVRTKSLKNRIVGTGEDKNFVIGLTLPLSMPLSDQRVLSYNVNAGINTISDYIPSPNLQYHFNQTSYIQAEIQIANPQHIQPVLLSQSKYEVSGQQGSYRFMTKSVFARKLYYFNLPIGINYSPFKNFYLGTGLQFSSLMSGVGFSETRGYNSLGPSSRDTLFNANYFKFGNDSLSGRLNNSEVRLTLDANYYWKKFTLGMRYNQALNNYVSIQVVPNTPVFTDRNKALQIYLRYNLWEDRKKKKTGSMAKK